MRRKELNLPLHTIAITATVLVIISRQDSQSYDSLSLYILVIVRSFINFFSYVPVLNHLRHVIRLQHMKLCCSLRSIVRSKTNMIEKEKEED